MTEPILMQEYYTVHPSTRIKHTPTWSSQGLAKNAFAWSSINASYKNRILWKHEYCCLFFHKLWTSSIKQTSLSKQGSTHKKTSYKWLVHIFVRNLIWFSYTSTCLHIVSLTLSRRRPLSYKNQSIDLRDQWTGFYMITASVMKELSINKR